MSNNIIVIGSINMDIVIKTKEIPKIGETVIGKEIIENPGGKGANQAVALAKLGAEVSFLGMIGNDVNGKKLISAMKEYGVDTSLIETVEGSSGTAFITVDDQGKNNIIVVPAANYKVDKNYINKHIDAIEKSKIVLLQHEIPIDTVKEVILLSKKLGKTTVLNPAPANSLEDEVLKNVDILIPNEYELGRISNIEIKDRASIIEASRYIIDKGNGVLKVITTLGEKGTIYVDKDKVQYFHPIPTDVVDTTAAGDSFLGGFLYSYMLTEDIFRSIDFGQKVASLTIQRYGAQVSLPTLKEVNGYNLPNSNGGMIN
ncbi:MAG: ribokinase [Tissierellales bacterium]